MTANRDGSPWRWGPLGLAELLGEEDRWWPAGASAEELGRQLEWIELQIRVKAEAFFARHPLPPAAIER